MTVGQLKKMLAELEADGKVNDNTVVVSNADELNYWYSPTIGKAALPPCPCDVLK